MLSDEYKAAFTIAVTYKLTLQDVSVSASGIWGSLNDSFLQSFITGKHFGNSGPQSERGFTDNLYKHITAT